VGQTPESDLREETGLSWNKKGMIDVSGSSALTGMEGVFAGGDCAGTKAFVADAIASGKRGALAIYCYLEGKDVNKEFENHRIGTAASFSFQHFLDPDRYLSDLKKIVPYEKVNTLCFSHAPRNDNPDGEQPGEGVKTFGEVVSGLDPALMSAEVERCFKCGTCTRCDFCFLICPDISIMKEEDGYRVRTDYCKGCSICATSCPRNVIEIGGGR
jgi:Pyruvate/2-oxoacid:ferredoxin oxidoreductase delta subunit